MRGAPHRSACGPAVPTRLIGLLALAALATLGPLGCVRRTIEITSDPSGALVILNDREVGRTPVEVEFTYYGDYDVRLSLEGHEPLVTVGKASAPIWDNVPLDLGAELFPADLESRVVWHFVLLPETGEGLLDRANAARVAIGAEDEADAAGAAGAVAGSSSGTTPSAADGSTKP